MDLESQVLRRIEEAKLARGEGLLVAVSGGLDSVVLLHLLASTKERHALLLEVGHADHQLRGSSGEDARFVREFAEGLGLKCHCEKLEVAPRASEMGVSIEMAARELRHGFLARVAASQGMRHIALAHHADDQVELFMLRMLRGSSSAGLAGMSPLSPSPADPSVALFRPLLDITKAELRLYASQHGLRFREDETNSCLDVRRNRIRNELIPLLRAHYGFGDGDSIRRTMEVLRGESAFIQDQAAAWMAAAIDHQSLPRFQVLPLALQRQIIHDQLCQLGVEPQFDLIETLRGGPDEWVMAGDARSVCLTSAGSIQERPAPTDFSAEVLALEISGESGRANFAGGLLRWNIEPSDGRFIKRSDTELFDADTLGSRIVLRHWRPGDRFQPCGMSCSVKLQDLWTNAKVDHADRRLRVVGQTDANSLFWAEGLRISEQHKITSITRRQLVWRWSRDTLG